MEAFRPDLENIKATYTSNIEEVGRDIDVLVYSVNHKQFKEINDDKFLKLLNENMQ